jgi:hypothetical protein
MTPKWEIKVVENAGELQGSLNAEDVVVPTKPLITDIKSQLMFIPKQFSWTVGWRAYVWQEEESGRFKDLTEDEFKRLLDEGTISYTRDDGAGSAVSEADTSGDEASDT